MGLTVAERMQALLDRKKIRRTSWVKGAYLFMRFDGSIRDEGGHTSYNPSLIDDSIGNYEIYEEPKLEIKPTDVGRVIVFKSGMRSLITSFWSGREEEVQFSDGSRLKSTDTEDIQRIVNVGEE